MAEPGSGPGAAAGGSPDLVEAFTASLRANLFSVHRLAAGDPLPDFAGAGVSLGLYGLLDSGSVALAGTPAEPRANSLLPDVHVTLLHEDRILQGLPELFAAVGGALPSVLAVVSGPSKSADIEQMLAVGVHGPKQEHVVLLPPGAPLPEGLPLTALTAADFRPPAAG